MRESQELGDFVRLTDYDADLALWKSNHAFASKLADDLTQDGIKDRARIRALEAALREVWSDPDVPGQFDEATIARVDALLPPSETSVQSAPHDWYCPNCDCDLCGAVQGRLERTAVETAAEPDDPNAPFRWICIHCTTVNAAAK